MTKEQLRRASALIHTRDEIKEFLSARDPDSELARSFLDSKYEFQREQGQEMPRAAVVEISLVDAERCDTADKEEPDNIHYWFIARDVLEGALRAYLPQVDAEIRALGIEAAPMTDTDTDRLIEEAEAVCRELGYDNIADAIASLQRQVEQATVCFEMERDWRHGFEAQLSAERAKREEAEGQRARDDEHYKASMAMSEKHRKLWVEAERKVERLRRTLESIAANTCCERCQEAAKWARDALAEEDSSND